MLFYIENLQIHEASMAAEVLWSGSPSHRYSEGGGLEWDDESLGVLFRHPHPVPSTASFFWAIFISNNILPFFYFTLSS